MRIKENKKQKEHSQKKVNKQTNESKQYTSHHGLN